jgi:hypothetical protein
MRKYLLFIVLNIVLRDGYAQLTPNGNGEAAPADSTGFAGLRDNALRLFYNKQGSNLQPALYLSATSGKNDLNPDMNTALTGELTSGDLSINNNLLPGSTYGDPIADTSNPDSSLPIVNADGTYTFLAHQPGKYNFRIRVCNAGPSNNCPDERVAITVIDPNSPANMPSINSDRVIVACGGSIAIHVNGNDGAGVPDRLLGRPAVSFRPSHGITATQTDGTILYTAAKEYTGSDSFVYTACDGGLCNSATVYITVQAGTLNTVVANDDYIHIARNTSKSGNVIRNDIAPLGETMSVSTQHIIVPGVGLFVMDTLGNFTFSPVPNFSGPANFEYLVCDCHHHCAKATLYVEVAPKINKLAPDKNNTLINTPTTGDLSTNDDLVPGSTYGAAVAIGFNPTTALPEISPDGTYSFMAVQTGVYNFIVPVCDPGQVGDCLTVPLCIAVSDSDSVRSRNNQNLIETFKDGLIMDIHGTGNPDDLSKKTFPPAIVEHPVDGINTHKYIFPNPVGDDSWSFVYQNFNIKSDKMEIRILDMQGRLVYKTVRQIETGKNVITLSDVSLTTGGYCLMFYSLANEVRGKIRFVKQ